MSFIDKHPWMTFFLGLTALGGIVTIAGYASGATKPYVAPTPTPASPDVTGPMTGQYYTFYAAIPAGITRPIDLASALVRSGWTDVKIWGFDGLGTTGIPGLPPLLNGGRTYYASGQWVSPSAPTPPGVTMIPGDFSKQTAFIPMATSTG
jgi:hypothetical protein